MPLKVSAKSPWAGKKGRTLGTSPKGRYPVAAVADRTLDGIVFDSKGEMMRYAHLQLGERAGLIRALKRQVKFDVPIGGRHFCSITFDFGYEEWDGRAWQPVIEEFKSAGTIREKDYHLRKLAAELHYRFTVRHHVAR